MSWDGKGRGKRWELDIRKIIKEKKIGRGSSGGAGTAEVLRYKIWEWHKKRQNIKATILHELNNGIIFPYGAWHCFLPIHGPLARNHRHHVLDSHLPVIIQPHLHIYTHKRG